LTIELIVVFSTLLLLLSLASPDPIYPRPLSPAEKPVISAEEDEREREGAGRRNTAVLRWESGGRAEGTTCFTA
jgi:hypothetical protein